MGPLEELAEIEKLARDEAVNDFRMDELDAVMHSVDKWLEGDELKENPATRAARAREKALCAIEDAGTRGEWMDIKDAPRDGTAVLACEMPHDWIGVVTFKDGAWSMGGLYPYITPTHYQPLPSPPLKKGA